MKTLQVGDYVKNLTEKQFDKIMELQPEYFGKYLYVKDQTDELICQGNYIGFIKGSIRIEPTTELTYLQFLLRAKNTFK